MSRVEQRVHLEGGSREEERSGKGELGKGASQDTGDVVEVVAVAVGACFPWDS